MYEIKTSGSAPKQTNKQTNKDKDSHNPNEHLSVIINDGQETETITPDIICLGPGNENQAPDVTEFQDLENNETNDVSDLGPKDVGVTDKTVEKEVTETIQTNELIEDDLGANNHVTTETAEVFQSEVDEIENQNQMNVSESS